MNQLLIIFLSLGLGAPTPAMAAQLRPVTYSTSTAEAIVRSYAVFWGVSGDEMWETTKCENPSLDPKKQSDYHKDGKREDSWGNSQINLYWNPHITKEQAQDPFFSANFMGEEFYKGNQTKWTCWRDLYGGNAPPKQ